MEATVEKMAEDIPNAGSRFEEWNTTVAQYLEDPNEESYRSVESQGDELVRQIDTGPRYSYSYISNGKALLGGLHALETVIQIPYIVEAYRVRLEPTSKQLERIPFMKTYMARMEDDRVSVCDDEGKVPVPLNEDEFSRLVRAVVAIDKFQHILYPNADTFRTLVRGIQPIIAQERCEEEKRLKQQEQIEERERLGTMGLADLEWPSNLEDTDRQRTMSLEDFEWLIDAEGV
jgi:hypothetical protein